MKSPTSEHQSGCGSSANIDENSILKRAIRQRDRTALAFLHTKYYSRMKHYIASHVNSIPDAEDLTQDVFVELCKGNESFNGCENAEKYLFGIARNIIRSYFRKKTDSARIIPIVSIDKHDAKQRTTQNLVPLHRLQSQEQKQLIENTVAQLPPIAREALKLRFIDGLNSNEAAKKAGCSIHAFCQRIYKAKKNIDKLKTAYCIRDEMPTENVKPLK
jgi:RNA polymerase sigma-70 factor (ECF subfamily)